MEINPTLQALYLGVLCIFGGAVAAAWGVTDVIFSLARDRGHRLPPLRFLCDFLLVAASGAGIIIFSYYYNRGEVRFFAVLGFLCAFFAARGIFSLLLEKPLKWIFRAFLHILYIIICVISTPLVKTFKYLVNNLQKIMSFIRKTLAKFGVLVYNIYTRKFILRKARKGFLSSYKRR